MSHGRSFSNLKKFFILPQFDKMDEVVILYCFRKLIKKKMKKRRFWVHPCTSNRFFTGHFYLNHPKLLEHPEKCFNYYRMSKTSFEELLTKISLVIKKDDTNMRCAIPPEERLALALR